MPSDSIIAPGEVWLVGAGPGDPELLTRRAERLIREAEVIFHDALVGPGILELAGQGARLVSVGKRSGHHSRDQATINDLLLGAALAGRKVVRLKGGDPSIFGRSAEEIEHLRVHHVPVHVVPGITAASAAAASAGISLTLRGMARRLQFVTAHARAGEELNLDWKAMADPDATLVVYMGRAAGAEVAERLIEAGLAGSSRPVGGRGGRLQLVTAQGRAGEELSLDGKARADPDGPLVVYMGRAAAAEVAERLIEAGLDAATPVMVVENASLSQERRFSTRLDLLGLAVKTAIGKGPALLLIGKAVAAASSPALAEKTVQRFF